MGVLTYNSNGMSNRHSLNLTSNIIFCMLLRLLLPLPHELIYNLMNKILRRLSIDCQDRQNCDVQQFHAVQQLASQIAHLLHGGN